MSWEWIFEKFRIAYIRREDMVIVLDRHESIIKGAKKIYPEVPNVFCIFHLLGNIKSKFKKNLKKIKDAFFSAANAYSVKKFQYHMKELEKVDKRVRVYLEDVGYEKWAKKNYLLSVDLTVNPTNHILFEVLNGDKKNVVDLNAKSCSCKRFQMDEISCAHAIVVFQKCNIDPYEYCSVYYKKETVVAAYKGTVYPAGNRDTWEVPQIVKSLIVNPPEGRIQVGRPKKRRCKASWEKNGKTLKPIICGKCKQSGHNRRSCRNPVKND
ncbi:hypothetical protein POM88_030932 [Heracleum sosnowskyi]|uniref:SWIM-type domain-containing protein n=1 Tax=Heracleum sosnowskyi TaxID=360622 RepID=A0AAD8HWF6_9APIA|nr:hypothetical protein POM88_030932 [Heracleum sosnowskyi]